jgi:Cu2+-exporting ATPase/Cu+-exporting ATPase
LTTSTFCCKGCETVYGLLQTRGLGKYYQLKATGRLIRKPIPANEAAAADDERNSSTGSRSYHYLDDPEFLRLYANQRVEGQSQCQSMKFYLEGVHCAACVWLTEKVADFVDHVESVRLDLASSVATVQLTANGSFAPVAEEFSRIGYRPHPVKQDEVDTHKKREERWMLIQLAVAGTCTGNIMLLAVSLYGGLDGGMGEVFKWVSFALFLPVFLFSAIPFYRSAWSAIRARQVSIDIPLVLGILLGSAMSLANLFMGSDHIYFDSLSALVFLLLASRYVLKRAQQNALNASNLIHFLTPSVARKKMPDGKVLEANLDQIRPGDLIEVRPGENIPVDAVIESGNSTLNCALLTGESRLQKVGVGETVFAGTLNQQAPIIISVRQSGGATRLGQILKSMEEHLNRRAPIVAFADKISKHFVTAVVALVGLVFLWGFRSDWHQALNNALALAIVTCPCAFALATPLAMTTSIGRSARIGILVKGGDVLEKLSSVKTLFLDKTGTLTTGNFEVLNWVMDSEASAGIEKAILALETHSNHPIAKALIRHLEGKGKVADPGLMQPADFRETIGTGVSGTVDGNFYEIGRLKDTDSNATDLHSSTIGIYCNGKLAGRVILGDKLREDSRAAIEILRSAGLDLRILSGDSAEAVHQVACQLGIPSDRTYSNKTPEQKSAIVAQTPDSMMVGDGANDAVALASAHVGVAVHSGMEVAMRAADSYLFSPGVYPVYRLHGIARETMTVIHRNFIFSLLYNLVGGAAAVLGLVNPLFAAILMPISAFTVLISSMVGTSKLRALTRETAPAHRTAGGTQ